MGYIAAMKIRTQLLVFILTTVIAGFGIASIFSYISSSRIVEKEVFDKADNVKKRYREFLNGYFKAGEKIALGMAHAVKTNDNISETDIHELLKANVARNSEIYGATVFLDPPKKDIGKKLFAPYYFKKGQLLKYTPADPKFKFSEQEWYLAPKKEGKPVWTEPYYDKGADAIMTTYSVPIYNKKAEFLGLATVDLELSFLTQMINSIQIGKTGYAMLLSRNGTFLTHPDKDKYVLKAKFGDIAEAANDPALSDLAEALKKGKTGDFLLNDPFTKKLSWASFEAIPSTGYSLVVFMPEDELLMNVKGLKTKLLWVGIIIAGIIIGVIIVISIRISNPIKALSSSARKIADGDLNEEIKTTDAGSEIGELTLDIKKMVATIKKTLLVIKEEKDKFERVFTTMSDGIVATNSDWLVMNFNHAAEKLLEVTPGINLMHHLSTRFKADLKLEDLLDHGKGERHFDLIRPETGQVKEMIFSGIINTIYDPEGRITSYVLTIRDVTSDRREDANKSNLLSLISHKLRTPLSVLLNTTSLFEDKLLGEMTEKQIVQIKNITDQGKKLQNLVNRLINFVAITDKERASLDEVEIDRYFDEFPGKCDLAIDNKKPDVTIKKHPDLGKCRVHKAHLDILLFELIENATKFNNAEKVLIDIDVSRVGNNLIVKVKDNGIGISPVYHEKIFERFFQIDKDFTGNTQGVGLGLSLVKAVVDSYGGHIHVDSHESSGTTFIIEMPVCICAL